MRDIIYCSLFILFMIGCGEQKQEEPLSGNEPGNNISEVQPDLVQYIPQSSDDSLAAEISRWLQDDYLKDDMEMMREIARQYRYFAADLNDDGLNEIMISFIGPWFCGSGGCTMLLLDQEFNVITRFTVMQTPIWAEDDPNGNWKLLLVRSSGELKELRYENGSYPSNPSVVEKAPYDAPSGHALIMFDPDFAPAKTYGF